MKKSIIKTGIYIVAFLSIIVSCQTTEETYSEFTKDGETVYIGTPTSISNAPIGINEVRLFIELNSDPKISKGVVLDNNKVVVKEFEIDLSSVNDNVLPLDLELNEGDHTLFVVLKDNSGNESIKKEVQLKSYGERYRSGLIPRVINSIVVENSTVIINWENISTGTLSSTLTYEDSTGTMQTLAVENETTETTLNDFKVGGNVFVTSSYKPTESSVFTFNSKEASYNFPM